MYTKIALVATVIGLLYSGTYIIELRHDLNQTEQQFTEYKKEVDKKFKDLEEIQKDLSAIKKDFYKVQHKAISDAMREKVVVQKPKIVEKQLNKSFNNLMNEVNEATK